MQTRITLCLHHTTLRHTLTPTLAPAPTLTRTPTLTHTLNITHAPAITLTPAFTLTTKHYFAQRALCMPQITLHCSTDPLRRTLHTTLNFCISDSGSSQIASHSHA